MSENVFANIYNNDEMDFVYSDITRGRVWLSVYLEISAPILGGVAANVALKAVSQGVLAPFVAMFET